MTGCRASPARRGTDIDYSEADAATIQQLARAVADLNRPVTVDHFVYELDDDGARALAQELEGRGYTVATGPADGGKSVVHASRETMVSLESITAARRELTELADQFGGEYDGWGAAVG